MFAFKFFSIWFKDVWELLTQMFGTLNTLGLTTLSIQLFRSYFLRRDARLHGAGKAINETTSG